jgi:elongation factor Ts
MALDTSLITKLRDMTGAGVADCKEALQEANNDLDKAVELLRKKGATKAAKKMAERTAGEGLIGSYIHANGKIGVLVELRCETDFVARNEAFQQLAKDISMQVAGANPLYLSPEDVTADVIEREKGIYREQLAAEGKPAEMIEKIIEGKLQKFYQEVCLLKQAFIKDDSITIEQLVQDNVAKLGEKIEVAKFVRYQI